jgi:hypothetical protein
LKDFALRRELCGSLLLRLPREVSSCTWVMEASTEISKEGLGVRQCVAGLESLQAALRG